MTYHVLARKWRPKYFADLVGQEHVVQALTHALSTGRHHHAYLLTGTRGVGKTTIARILAKRFNCETSDNAEPCGQCNACCAIDAGRFIDLLEIDAASNTGIDHIREVLENAQYAPSQGRYTIYIIDEVHMLSKSAFNAMLKTLEEPPLHVKFILATTDPQKIPLTVLSRCLQFNLRNMSAQSISQHLAHVLTTEELSFESAALTLLGRAAAGSMRDALSLLDRAIAFGAGSVSEQNIRSMLGCVDQSLLFNMLNALADFNGPTLIRCANTIIEQGMSADRALTELMTALNQLALLQTTPETSGNDPDDERYRTLAKRITAEDLQLFYQIALQGYKDIGFAPDEQAGLSMTLLRMLAFHPLASTNAATAAPYQAASWPIKEEKNKIDTVSPINTESAQGSALRPWLEPPQVVSPPPPPTFDGNWEALVAALSPRMGAARMLAHNAVFKSYSPGHFTLAVSKPLRHLAARDYQEKLRRALCEHFSSDHLLLTLNIEDSNSETPAMKDQRARQEQHSKARCAFEQDPMVQQLASEFDALLLMDTVKPV